MKVAYNLFRDRPHYRRSGFSDGLRAVGFEVKEQAPKSINPGDLVLSWNRYSTNHDICTMAEKAGATVLIAENAYVGPGGIEPHAMTTRQWYALAVSAHNDHRVIPEGDGSRWNALGVDLKPWRTDGGHILICPNRSFGTPGRIMPQDWTLTVGRKLAKLTDRKIRIRPHPGAAPAVKPLAEDLAGAWACIIWGSSAGVHALIAGIPVICLGPAWICKSTAGSSLEQIEAPPMLPRFPALERLARGQFSIDEIATGEPFRSLLP